MEDVSLSHLEAIEQGEPTRLIEVELQDGRIITFTSNNLTPRDIAKYIRKTYPNLRRWEEI